MKYLVAIDPGHGGENTGTTEGGIVEKDLNLEVAEILRDEIDTMDWNCEACILRDSDVDVSLSKRGQLSKEHGADLVLSMHVNALKRNTNARGLHTFHWPGNKEGFAIAEAIAQASPPELRRGAKVIEASKKDWRRNAWNVLRPHPATCVLVEMGFSTHKPNAEYLLTDEGMGGVVSACVAGISWFLDHHKDQPSRDSTPEPSDDTEPVDSSD